MPIRAPRCHSVRVRALAASVACAVLGAGTTACGGGQPHTANQICTEAVPNWQTATATTVGYVRHFKSSALQRQSPFEHAFGSSSDSDLAAWCWVQRGTKTFRAYAATNGEKPIMIAEITGASTTAPKGPPTIL